MLKLLTFFPDARIDSVTLRDFRIFKPSAGKLFIQPFTERSTQGQYIVNKKNLESTVIMNNAPFLRICAETAHYGTFTLFILLHSCAGPVPARKKTGAWRRFPVCQLCHSNFRRPQVFMWAETHLKTVKRPEVRVFGEAPAAEKSKRPASGSKVPEDSEGWNESIRKGLQLFPRKKA